MSFHRRAGSPASRPAMMTVRPPRCRSEELRAGDWRFESELHETFRIQLDDELFLHGQVDLLARRQLTKSGPTSAASVEQQPLGNPAALHFFHRVLDRRVLARSPPHGDHVALAHRERRDVHLLAVHGEVPVAHELARLRPRGREPEPVDHVVEPALEHLEQQHARDALLPIGRLEVAAELVLEHAVGALDLLLLAQLDAVADHLRLARAAVLAGRHVALLDRALLRVAALALQEELHALAPAQPADWTDIPRHSNPFDLNFKT